MGISSSTGVLPLESNFLVPNGTFLVSLLAFAILVWIFGKYLIPPINKAMTERQEAIRKEFADLEDAQADARQAEADYKEQLNNAKHEAARIREEAREQGAQIVQEARDKAQTEADRIIEHAHTQIEADRKAAVASLRRDVGSLATTLAGRIVGESMDDDERQGRVVERFLADLEEAH
jgi:F-type H+-transporting ATPase subunit b